MKHLIVILLLASKFCSGQDYKISSGGVYQYSQDTVPIFMLVMDTLHYSNHTPQLNEGNYFDKAGTATWVRGKAVRKITVTKAGEHMASDGFSVWYQQEDEISYNTIEYLDWNKKPLSKYIVVWMAQY